jgi:hypothetical protein
VAHFCLQPLMVLCALLHLLGYGAGKGESAGEEMGPRMRRMVMLLTAALMVALMMVMLAAPALAGPAPTITVSMWATFSVPCAEPG